MPETIPSFQTLMLPVLRDAEAGEVRISETVERLADSFGLSADQRALRVPSGQQTVFGNRVTWAKSYLAKAGLIDLTRRAYFQVNDRGRAVLASAPDKIDLAFLRQFPEFRISRSATGDTPLQNDENVGSELTPDETIRRARDQIEADLSLLLLSRIQSASPAFFEGVVIRLLTAMGYGGSVADAGRALGQSGDGGVDGVIDEDALGLDRIYVQAKRYRDGNAVGAGAIRDFFGALDQFKASKGVFVTTSSFTAAARQTAEGLSKRIVLIDGPQLAVLLIRFGVGCRVEETISIKRLDEDFFES